MRSLPRSLTVLAALALSQLAFGEVEVKKLDDRVRVEIGGKLFTEYRFAGAPHVYYYPLIGPGGAKMTRAWPMEDAPGEEHDHPHHRSMWFSHGLVNGVDFWSEDTSHGTRKPKHPIGKIEHDRIVEVKSGKTGVVRASQKWVAPDGSVPLTSVQTLTVHDRPETERVFDFEIALTAGAKDVLLGDTKEGTFAIRIAESMRLKGAKGQPSDGHIANSEGDADDTAWGKAAKWVDMSGPVDGKVLGIAVFDHPANLRHPTRWHARDYGLFAANPFCGREMDKTLPAGAADHTIKAGETLTLKYRVFIHEGDAAAAKVAERYGEYLGK